MPPRPAPSPHSAARDWFTADLADLEQQHLRRQVRQIDSLPHGLCRVEGRVCQHFAGNDYLGLAQHPELSEAARRALLEHGVGAGASPLVAGYSRWHLELEQRLAWFEQTEAALLFPTGYAANLGTIAALASRGDTVFCDRHNHACVVDGCRLSGARLRVYRHTQLDRLERELRDAGGARRRLIVTDAVFSMEGVVAPLAELAGLAERYDALLVVDEAHGTGVWGPGGRGACAAAGVADRVPVRIGTLSKALGCLGGFVCGSQPLIDWLRNHARTQIYSTALPAAVCAAASRAVELLQANPNWPSQVWALSDRLREGLSQLGLESWPGSQGPIVPVVVPDPERLLAMARGLVERGQLVAAIRPPTVPRNTSRLRISLSAAHSTSALEGLLEALRELT
ncbi:MAG: 8-amino-7-oxononanoate synthase, partial [Planctomycetaceae bacterium]